MSPSAAAPSRASIKAWITTSASECPSRPNAIRNVYAAQEQWSTRRKAMDVVTNTDAGQLDCRCVSRMRASSRSYSVVTLKFPIWPGNTRTS